MRRRAKLPMLVLVLLLPASVPATYHLSAQERVGAFVYTPRVDPLTGVDDSLVSTAATSNPRARLVWFCGRARLRLYVDADEFLRSEGRVDVRWRFDQEEPSSTRRWFPSADGTAAFSTDRGRIQFTHAARSAAGVLVRVTDFRGVTYDLRFVLDGLASALSRLPCVAAAGELRARIRARRGDGAPPPQPPTWRVRPIQLSCRRPT